MLYKYNLKTDEKGFYNISQNINEAIRQSGVKSGLCVVHCPHTTAAITINENTDPDVCDDLNYALNKTFPNRAEFKHMEGNSDAHLKSSCVGCSQTIIIENSRPVLGIWQGVYFVEFDPPRQRSYYVKIISD